MLENLTLSAEAHSPQRITFAGRLSDLNLESEVLENYARAKSFLEGLDEEGIAPNQYAQVINTLTAILKDLAKIQTDLYSAERVKALEGALIATMRTTEPDVQEKFFALYEKRLSRIVS